MSYPLLTYSDRLNKEILNIDRLLEIDSTKNVDIPSCGVWLDDKRQFVEMIKEYKAQNETLRKKSNKWKNTFIVSGAIIGLGGGIYGLLSQSEPKGAAITSLVSGSLTGILGSLNIENKGLRSKVCSEFLNGILLDYDVFWGPTRCPNNANELRIYLKSKDDIIESLKSMKCYGIDSL